MPSTPPAFPADIRIAPALGVATGTAAGNQHGPAATTLANNTAAKEDAGTVRPAGSRPPVKAKRKRKAKRRATMKKSRRARMPTPLPEAPAEVQPTVAAAPSAPAPSMPSPSDEEAQATERSAASVHGEADGPRHQSPLLPVPGFSSEAPLSRAMEPALAPDTSPPAIPLPPGEDIHALTNPAPAERTSTNPPPAPLTSEAQRPAAIARPDERPDRAKAPQGHGPSRPASAPLPRNRSLARPPSGFIATISNWLGSALRLATLGLVSTQPKRHAAPRKRSPGPTARHALRSAPPGSARIQPQAPPRQPSPPLREATELAQLRAENRRLRLELERLQERNGVASPSPAVERGNVGA